MTEVNTKLNIMDLRILQAIVGIEAQKYATAPVPPAMVK